MCVQERSRVGRGVVCGSDPGGNDTGCRGGDELARRLPANRLELTDGPRRRIADAPVYVSALKAWVVQNVGLARDSEEERVQ